MQLDQSRVLTPEIDRLRLEVALAMQTGSNFEDCMTPAQAVEIVRDHEPLVIQRRPVASAGRLLREAA